MTPAQVRVTIAKIETIADHSAGSHADGLQRAAEILAEDLAASEAEAAGEPKRVWDGVNEETGRPDADSNITVDAESWARGPLIRVAVWNGKACKQMWLTPVAAAEVGQALIAASKASP